MELINFCNQTVKDPCLVQKHRVILVNGSVYPMLFLTWWGQWLRANFSDSFVFFDCGQGSTMEAQAQLSSYCFGSSFIYWVRPLIDLERGQKKEWISFLRSYEGPHTLILFYEDVIEPMAGDSWTVVNAPSIINYKQYMALSDLFVRSFSISSNVQFAERLFSYKSEISFDFACKAVWYALLAGKDADQFFSSWIHELLVPEQSLFILGQHFFAQQGVPFFKLWHSMKDVYPLAFWVTFWADQLWRAYIYIELMQQNKWALAKKAGFRLPFSFLQKDWKRHTLSSMQQALDRLYTLDYRYKQGQTSDLELFYCSILY